MYLFVTKFNQPSMEHAGKCDLNQEEITELIWGYDTNRGVQ